MKITSRTPLKSVLPLLTDDNLADVLQQVHAANIPSFEDWTVSVLADVATGEMFSRLAKTERYAVPYLATVKAYTEQMEALGQYIERISVTQTAEEKKASVGVSVPPLHVRMCIDLVKFFGLHSFEEAEKMKVGDWLVIHWDASSSEIIRRNHAMICSQNQHQ